MFNDKLSFLSKYVQGIKASEKRLKSFEYFRILSTAVGFVFLQETLPSRCRKKMEKQVSRIVVFHTVKQIIVESP